MKLLRFDLQSITQKPGGTDCGRKSGTSFYTMTLCYVNSGLGFVPCIWGQRAGRRALKFFKLPPMQGNMTLQILSFNVEFSFERHQPYACIEA